MAQSQHDRMTHSYEIGHVREDIFGIFPACIPYTLFTALTHVHTTFQMNILHLHQRQCLQYTLEWNQRLFIAISFLLICYMIYDMLYIIWYMICYMFLCVFPYFPAWLWQLYSSSAALQQDSSVHVWQWSLQSCLRVHQQGPQTRGGNVMTDFTLISG